jgi:methyl-accepting chemotaxis protein
MIMTSVVALLIVGSVGLYVSSKETESIKLITEDSLPSIEKLAETRQAFMITRINVMRLLMTTEPEAKGEAEKRIEQPAAAVLKKLAEYEKLLSNDEDKKLLQTDLSIFNNYLDFLKTRLFTHVRSGEMGAERKQIAAEETALSIKTREALEAHIEFNQKNADAMTKLAYASAAQGKIIVLVTLAISVLAIAVLGYFLQTNIKQSLNQIQGMVTKVEHDLDFTVRVNVTKHDEIGQTTVLLNRLLDKLQGNLKSISEGAHSVASAASLMSTTSTQVATASHQQSESASDMAATVEEMTVSINHVGDRAQEANRISSESGELAVSGVKVISQTVSDIQEIATNVHDAAELIHGLEQHSQEISKVVAVIKEVADQTNLLALNAAIEAARAGEQGRGFAVVADEVRKLAERTALSTQEISSTISTMLSSAGNAVISMESVVTKVTKGVESAQEANAAIKQIGEGSRNAVGMVEEITSAIREQATATNNIAMQVERIAQMSEESSAAAGNSAETAQDLDRLATDMQRIVSAYRL